MNMDIAYAEDITFTSSVKNSRFKIKYNHIGTANFITSDQLNTEEAKVYAQEELKFLNFRHIDKVMVNGMLVIENVTK